MNLEPFETKAMSAGDKYQRLTILGTYKKPNTYRYYAKCLCDCGAETIARIDQIKSGNTSSCGCYHKEQTTSHRMTGHRLMHIWRNIISRCTNESDPVYPRYGGRGITVCQRWLDMKNFVEDMYPSFREGLSIDRIDNDKGYYPENCRWATPKEQALNRRSVRLYKYKGETKSISEWAEHCGVCYGTFWERLTILNWPIDKCIETPARKMARPNPKPE